MQLSESWVPQVDDRRLAFYTRNPITQTVSRFQLTTERKMKRSETDFCNLGGLNWEGRRFNRLKGVVEIGDKTHAFYHRYRKEYSDAVQRNQKLFNLRSSPVSRYLDDSIAHRDMNPFRVGR